jgi:hypothetical protein
MTVSALNRPLAHSGGAEGFSLAGPATLATIIIVLLPLALVAIPPLTDYPNHLARMHIIATLDRDPMLSQFYRIDWALIPNLMMDLVVPPLARLIGVYEAGRLFVAAIVVQTLREDWLIEIEIIAAA